MFLFPILATLVLVVAAPDESADKKKVLDLIKTQVDAWNRGDIHGFCEAYAEDALFLAPSGLTRGRAAVEARYKAKYGNAKESMGTLSIEPIEVRTYPQTNAVAGSVAAKWSLNWKDKPPASGHTLIIFQRTPKGFELVSDASM